MDRRTYLKQIAYATGGLMLSPHLLMSCKESGEAINLTGKFTLEPYKSIEEMQQALRNSKGHLSQEMKRVILTKDASQIVAFVQNRFATIPSLPYRVDDETSVHRWGIRGLLRCGKGTLREKSDLLFTMLQEAGFNPVYKYTTFPINKAQLNTVFCAPAIDNNTFEAPRDYTKKWEEQFQKHAVTQTSFAIDNVDQKATQLSEHIAQYLPDNYSKAMQDYSWLDTQKIQAPVIRLEEAGMRKDINLVEQKEYPDFTEISSGIYSLDVKKKSNVISTIRIILRATYSDNVTKQVELVRGEWSLETLIGRQVALQFNTPVPTQQVLLSSYNQINQFVPFLNLRAPDMELEDRKKLSAKGVGFDMFGNTFETDGDGAIRMNGMKMNTVETTDTSIIKDLKVVLSDAVYPKIQLRLAPLDASGKPVLGLGGQAFKITDQGKEILPVIIQNTKSPRVLVLLDVTISMPLPYSYGTLPEAVQTAIRNGLATVFYDHTLSKKTHLQDLKEVLETIDIQSYDHIFVIGDGGEFEKIETSWFTNKFKNSSISYHYVKSNITTTFKEDENPALVRFRESGHPYYTIESIDQDVKTIAQQIADSTLYPYVLEYEAPEEGDNLVHKVLVGITDNDLVPTKKMQYTYQREGKDYQEAVYPCGLSMELQWTENYNSKSIVRHLAGFHPERDDVAIPLQKYQVKDFAMGTHLICFEADKATFPAMMDDILSDPLSLAPFMEEREAGDNLKKAISLLEDHHPLPVKSIGVFYDIPNATSKDRVTFENAFQTALYSSYLDTLEGNMIEHIDMLGTSDIRTLAPTKKEAFQINLQKTAYLALSEAVLYPISTHSELEHISLARFTNNTQVDLRDYQDRWSLYKKEKDYFLLYDPSNESMSYWQIDKKTGALLGILPDESGGGRGLSKENIDLQKKIFKKWAKYYVKAFSGGRSMSIVSQYAIELAATYGTVALLLNDFKTNGLPSWMKGGKPTITI